MTPIGPAFELALSQQMAKSDRKLRRGQVWCHSCGATLQVDSAACIRTGWPLCCGHTMSLDSPKERKAGASSVTMTIEVRR